MKKISDAGDLRGKRVFLRCDFNVPTSNGAIDDDYRIRKALPTIQFLRERGARIILASHIEAEGDSTLRPVRDYLEKLFPLSFIDEYFPTDISARVDELPEGGVMLLENLRKYAEEKGNDETFAKHLASCADLYVDDAFATAHRPHASIVGVPKFIPGFAGFLMQDEVEHLSATFNPPHPFLFILGGAKLETKLPLIKKFLPLADTIFVGGALANDLYEARGFNIGTSKFSADIDTSDIEGNPKILTPSDVVVSNQSGKQVKLPNEVTDGDMIVDAGPQALVELQEKIKSARFILWNGPLGDFEIGFKEGTDELARFLADTNAETIVGGGDTLSSIAALGVEEKFSFVSTGGGAMLDFLAMGTLPGIDALG